MSEVTPWPLFGYAPGGYFCKCSTCTKQFTGDKRAVMCLECAARAANEALAERASMEGREREAFKAGAEEMRERAVDSQINRKRWHVVAELEGLALPTPSPGDKSDD